MYSNKEQKKRRTFEDLIKEEFATEEDLVELRNILIDGNIVIFGSRLTGLPLLLAIICEILRDEIGFCPYMIYDTDLDYDYKINRAKTEIFDRVILQGVSNINILYEAEQILKKGNPIIICVEDRKKIPLDFNYFDYSIEMSHNMMTTSIKIDKIKRS